MNSRTHTETEATSGPQIIITVSPENRASDIETAIRTALHTHWEVTHPQPILRNTGVDDYGTPLSMMVMPNEWNSKIGFENMDMRQPINPMSMLAMRMGWGGFAFPREFGMDVSPPFEHISIYRGEQKTFVFLVHGGEPLTIEDDTLLFPSDALVTRLRMLKPEAQTGLVT